MIEQDNTGPHSISMLINAHELKLYMTRPALVELASRLLRISEASPEECFEIHVSSHFSRFDEQDRYISPNLRFTDGFESVIEEIRKKDAADLAEPWTGTTTFELTIMHVSPAAVAAISGSDGS